MRPRMISSSNRDGGSSSSSGSSSNAHGSSQERREMQRQRKQPAKGRPATALIAAAATAGANAGANATGRGGERNGARTADGIGSFSSTATSGLEVLEFLLASVRIYPHIGFNLRFLFYFFSVLSPICSRMKKCLKSYFSGGYELVKYLSPPSWIPSSRSLFVFWCLNIRARTRIWTSAGCGHYRLCTTPPLHKQLWYIMKMR